MSTSQLDFGKISNFGQLTPRRLDLIQSCAKIMRLLIFRSISVQPRSQGLSREWKALGSRSISVLTAPPPFSYTEPFLRAVNGARRGALAKSISNWHLIGYNEGYCSNTGYVLLPCFYGFYVLDLARALVAPRVRRALGTRMVIC
jgi:hypothetical protein